MTRGTTGPNRLRRVDRWIGAELGDRLRRAADPLVVDLGFGSTPVTTVELRARLVAVRPGVRVVGVEIDPVRVAAAQPSADPPGLTFTRGGFELAGLRPVIVRAMNVLRQYGEPEVAPAWSVLCGALAPGGAAVEGTCDELGRIAAWVLLERGGPVSLTLAAKVSVLSSVEGPALLAERLPKALIHHNVPGTRVHALLAALDHAWRRAAPLSAFGPRQRWVESVRALGAEGWPVLGQGRRARLGELTVAWPAVAP
ncbi:MAG TPA: class I SAM-dependent methyltransferase [Rugosimonospora sp.]|nr:class I SAM-dependent methyltransferase [Rugosimonospora sp.]